MSEALTGKRVLVTREASQSLPLINLLEKNGASCDSIPLIQFKGIKNEYNETKLKTIVNHADWLFFTSANTVHFFDDYRKELQLPVQQKIAAVGEKTTKFLTQLHYTVDFQPTIYNGKTMVNEFIARYGKPYIGLITGEQARKEIPELLKGASVPFEKSSIYQTIKNKDKAEQLNETVPYVDAVFFTSPSTVEAFCENLSLEGLREAKKSLITIAIGNTTANTLKSCHFQRVIYPETFTIEHMVDCYIRYVNYKEKGD